MTISIASLVLALSILGTGTFLHDVYTSHVPEKKINSKDSRDPEVRPDIAINNKIVFMYQPFNYYFRKYCLL